jgi:polyribonucleotide nucleotidyltransferase
VLVTAHMSDDRSPMGFLPLTVEYEERHYAIGKIPGSFLRREGRPANQATLNARLIDRQIRPLFPKGLRNEIQVIVTVLSADQENDPAPLWPRSAPPPRSLSDIPWNGPVACTQVGYLDDAYVVAPTLQQLLDPANRLELTVAASSEAVLMVEAAADELPEDVMVGAIELAHASWPRSSPSSPDAGRRRAAEARVRGRRRGAPRGRRRPHGRRPRRGPARRPPHPGQARALGRREGAARRPDRRPRPRRGGRGRQGADRPAQGRLRQGRGRRDAPDGGRGAAPHRRPRPAHRAPHLDRDRCAADGARLGHLHARRDAGARHATLGTGRDNRLVDDLGIEKSEEFMLHYNFPPYSTGEAKRLRGVGRRELGHGNLAKRALARMVPSKESFPYVLRVVGETLESNGSSSMATVCAGSLALMDAGVPLRKPVAGIAMGLVMEGARYAVLSDILGSEDALGDMDFKVCGTRDGVTALQMDIKITGITPAIMQEALEQARDGRLHILGVMDSVLPAPRPEVSARAPRIISVKIPSDKIGTVIGPGGKQIRELEALGAKVEIEEDGHVRIYSDDAAAAQEVKERIQALTAVAELGKVYDGVVAKVVDFGAFITLFPGTDGLLHISQMAEGRVEQVSDVLKEGDRLQVKVNTIDERGKIDLIRPELEGLIAPRRPAGPRPDRGPRRDDRGPRRDGDRGPRRSHD